MSYLPTVLEPPSNDESTARVLEFGTERADDALQTLFSGTAQEIVSVLQDGPIIASDVDTFLQSVTTRRAARKDYLVLFRNPSMLPSYRLTLRTACKQYGPGRLPKADQPDIGAGYAAASAAVFATILFGIVLGVYAVPGTAGDWISSFLFPALALPVVVPSAFFLGVVGWRLSPSSSSITGIVAGGVGAVATYLVSLILVGGVLTAGAIFSLTGATPVEAVEFSATLVALAFILTWWITIPVGCLSGLVYMNVTEKAANAG